MSDALRELPADLADRASWTEAARIGLPALASLGMIAASLAAIPTVLSFATVSTSTFAFFSTSAVSIPLLLVGATAVGAASLIGVGGLTWADRQVRKSYRSRVKAFAYREILGFGASTGARSVLSDIQAVILRSSQIHESAF